VVQKALEEGMVTNYADWKKVDEEEVRRGEAIGKERERMGWVEASKFLNKPKKKKKIIFLDMSFGEMICWAILAS
jgi:hypothetical protein